MKLPDTPRSGLSLEESITQIIRYLRAATITGITGGRVSETPNGTTLVLPGERPVAARGDSSARYQFRGLVKIEDVWRIGISPGLVFFNQIRDHSVFADDSPKPKQVRAVIPTIRVGGSDVPIDDAIGPTLELGARTSATVWLVVADNKCSSGLDKERLLVADRGKMPEGAERGNVCVPIVDFDVTTEGDQKTATNVYQYLSENHQQPYLCDETDADSGSDLQSTPDSWPEGSSESGITFNSDSSGSEDSEEEEICQVAARAWWVTGSIPSCWPEAAEGDCVPKERVVTLNAKFFRSLHPVFGQKDCARWAFGVSLLGGEILPAPPGGGNNEYVWIDDWEKQLEFKVARPPICQIMEIKWRVKAFAPPEGALDGGGEPFACCVQEWGGFEKIRVYAGGPYQKLPKVCGKKCSSCSGP
jgi:hypothetical protein